MNKGRILPSCGVRRCRNAAHGEAESGQTCTGSKKGTCTGSRRRQKEEGNLCDLPVL